MFKRKALEKLKNWKENKAPNEYFRLKSLNYNTDPGPDEPIATFDSENDGFC